MRSRIIGPLLIMVDIEIGYHRLLSQHLIGNPFNGAGRVVQHLGAVQAQDYAAAKWAIAQRSTDLTDRAIDQAFADGSILRTHVMRPTWHFVHPQDIRWMLALTAPHVRASNAYQYRGLELDHRVFRRSNAVFSRALLGGRQLTRTELENSLEKSGIPTGGLRLVYLIMEAELGGILCSGGRRGNQFTYALLDERVRPAITLEREEALAELTVRYFTGHGPATEKDFMWWSGLSREDVRNGLEMIGGSLGHEEIAKKTYWFDPTTSSIQAQPRRAFLLPNYDEYIVGYTDRGAIFDPSHAAHLDARHNPLFQNTLLINNQIAGAWKRTIKPDRIILEIKPFAPLGKENNQALELAAERYGHFLERPVTILHADKTGAPIESDGSSDHL